MAAHASSRLFSGRNVDRTRESGGNRAYDLVPLRVLVCQRDEVTKLIANEPAERRRSAGEVAENSAARRMAYAKKFSIEL